MTTGAPKPDYTFLLWSVGGIVVSSLALAVFHLSGWSWTATKVGTFAERLVEAVLIASMLAASVDTFFKKQLAKDAFEASIGYILPEYLRDEMAAIYSNQIVCTDHSQTVEIIPLESSNHVMLKVSIERVLKNISNSDASSTPIIIIDEWLTPVGSSEIIGAGYSLNGKDDTDYGADECSSAGPPVIMRKAKPISLRPGDIIRAWYSYKVIKQRSDVVSYGSKLATNRPRVRVISPDCFEWDVQFDHRADAHKQKYTGEVVLPGLLLPNQGVLIKWWDKDKANAWHALKKQPPKPSSPIPPQGALTSPSASPAMAPTADSTAP